MIKYYFKMRKIKINEHLKKLKEVYHAQSKQKDLKKERATLYIRILRFTVLRQNYK